MVSPKIPASAESTIFASLTAKGIVQTAIALAAISLIGFMYWETSVRIDKSNELLGDISTAATSQVSRIDELDKRVARLSDQLYSRDIGPATPQSELGKKLTLDDSFDISRLTFISSESIKYIALMAYARNSSISIRLDANILDVIVDKYHLERVSKSIVLFKTKGQLDSFLDAYDILKSSNSLLGGRLASDDPITMAKIREILSPTGADEK